MNSKEVRNISNISKGAINSLFTYVRHARAQGIAREDSTRTFLRTFDVSRSGSLGGLRDAQDSLRAMLSRRVGRPLFGNRLQYVLRSRRQHSLSSEKRVRSLKRGTFLSSCAFARRSQIGKDVP